MTEQATAQTQFPGGFKDVVEFFNSDVVLAAGLKKEDIERTGMIPLRIFEGTLYYGSLGSNSLQETDGFFQRLQARSIQYAKSKEIKIIKGDLEVMLNRAFAQAPSYTAPLAAVEGPKRGGIFSRATKPENVDDFNDEHENRDMDPSKVWDLDYKDQTGARLGHDGKPLDQAQSYLYTIVQNAIERKATDIHVEAEDAKLRIRYRIDGELIEANQVPRLLRTKFIATALVNSTIDVGKPQLLESGRAGVKFAGKLYDIRIEKNVSVKGQELVMRILDKSANWSIDTLNFSPENKALIKQSLRIPYGLILVTGPTGSGKSTTLFAMNQILVESGKKKILTIEDPVEYEIKGANQVIVNKKADRTFETALPSFLRQDPDVIMVGEIRKEDVATLAAQAAETGHLVLSTLHTNDAAGAFPRLSAMGLRLDMMVSAVELVMAQRLVRRVNPIAWETAKGMASEVIGPVWIKSGLPDEEVNVAVQPRDFTLNDLPMGHSAPPELTQGRIAIHEVLYASEQIKELVNRNAPSFEIKRLARKEGMLTMWQDGLRKVGMGLISMDSLLDQVKPDDGMILEDGDIVLGRWDLRITKATEADS